MYNGADLKKKTPIPGLFFSQDYLDFWKPVNTNTVEEAGFIQDKLELKKGSSVLDLCCGYGRHSNLLAQDGHNVTGADISGLLLNEAKHQARKKGLSTKFVKIDVRNIKWKNQFDGCFNFFTSFGLYSDHENEKIIKNVYRALKKDGRFLLETMNREWLIRNFRPTACSKEKGGFLLQFRELDLINGYIYTKCIIIRAKSRMTYRFSIRMYTANEMYKLFKCAGFKEIEIFGILGDPYDINDKRMVVVGRK